MRDLIAFLVKSLVDHPENVEVRTLEGKKSILIEVEVKKDDMGKVIGKKGRLIRAIRELCRAAGIKLRKKVMVELLSQEE
ncbi:MAG: KH domain-containing protein [Synergistetes bacterium]|nr:KH domain-containing protein [Synergistota bacterium]MDW8192315.1 KH domain-containing protein [Synergistota bacterium]